MHNTCMHPVVCDTHEALKSAGGFLLPASVFRCWLSLQAAIANLRPATMELGGKSCLIIFDDAGGRDGWVVQVQSACRACASDASSGMAAAGLLGVDAVAAQRRLWL